jgi:hypothetical protein
MEAISTHLKYEESVTLIQTDSSRLDPLDFRKDKLLGLFQNLQSQQLTQVISSLFLLK